MLYTTEGIHAIYNRRDIIMQYTTERDIINAIYNRKIYMYNNAMFSEGIQ